MPRTKGAKSWSLHDAKTVAHKLRKKKKLSVNDPDVIQLSKELGRSVRGVRHLCYAVRKGTFSLLNTGEGQKVLGKYVNVNMGEPKTKLKDRLTRAFNGFKSNERMMKVSDHHKLVTNLSKHHEARLKDMVVISYSWGYNQGLADFRGKFLDATALDKKVPDVNKELMMETSKILFNAR